MNTQKHLPPAEARRVSVSVIVPCRNEWPFIRDFLASIEEQQLDTIDLEVIVADGMSTDGTREFLQEASRRNPNIRMVENPGRIVSCGLNRALEMATGDVIVRMDVHTTYAKDYIRSCVETLEATGADNVGGPWIAKGTRYLSRAIAAAFESPFGNGGARGHQRSHCGPVDTVYLGCWPRQVFDRVGRFDEDLVRNQDDEFNLRLHRAGGLIWQSPAIVSYYHPRACLSKVFRQYFQYGFWKPAVMKKHHRPASLRHLVPAGFVLALVVSLVAALAGVFAPGPVPEFFRWVFLSLAAAYAAASVAASLHSAAKQGWSLAAVLPAVFAVYHIGYGLGSIAGFGYWMLFQHGGRRLQAQPFSNLTR